MASVSWGTLSVWLAVGATGLFLSLIFSGFETGWYRLSEVRLRVRAERGGGWWRRLAEMSRRRDQLIVVLLIGNNVANYAATASAAVLLSATGATAHETELYSALIVMPLLFVIGEMVPKTLFQMRADALTVRWTWLIAASWIAFTYTGLVWAIRSATAGIMWVFGHRGQASDLFTPRDRIRDILLDQTASGVLSDAQLELARNVLAMRAVPTREVMRPLVRAAVVEAEADGERVRQIAAERGLTRLLVHASGDPRTILGYVSVYDVLLDEAGSGRAGDHVREAVRLSAGGPFTMALLALQEARSPIGVVYDGRGRAIGLVTRNDLVREILGELPDDVTRPASDGVDRQVGK